ncbi:MAG: hypothetical protein MI807_03915, partial [Verrucomicrobiales bacterium]|nr:hypothetical protein [Verrucomicrobiales bacterium]
MAFEQTFHALISGRAFDRYQDGLRARFKAHKIGYSVTYGEPTSKPAMWLDFDTPEAIGRATVWETGECDLEVLDPVTGEDLFREHHEFQLPEEFHSSWKSFEVIRSRSRDPNKRTSRRTQPDTRWESIDFRDSIPYPPLVAALSVSGEWPLTF